ncbi:flagellar filament capping protein FliD [Alloalcanivorax venustensis]|uniref:flagellar filament capping protein FliD n=1 Tax=Alloalcanivorax venustensis TaxID=172371 RepID=UPI003516D6D0
MASISSLGIGSGLDLNGLLDQMESAERQQLAPITQQQKSYQAKISAYGTLEGKLDDFREAAAKLSDSRQFDAVKSNVSGDALTAVVGEDALPGTHDIVVNHKARAYSIATQGVADKTEKLGAGAISFTLGNGDNFSIDVGEDQSSLEGIRDAINEAGKGVQASLVNDGSGQPHRLVLSATETGTDAAIASVDFGTGGLGATLAVDAGTEVTAINASLSVNGIDIENQSNRVEGAVQGVTLNLEEEGAATISVTRDTAGIKKAVTSFVESYNSLQKSMDSLTSYDQETGTSGELLGDTTLRGIESRIRGVMGGVVSGGEFSALSDIGVDLTIDGTLEVDDEKLDAAVADNLGALTDFFSGTGESEGLAGQLDATLGKMLGDSGTIENATSGLEDRIEGLGERYLRTEERIESTIARYREQFSKLDSMIAEMNSTSSYLTQQFDSLNAQLSQ